MKEEGISLTPHYHFHPLHRHLDVSRVVAAENLSLHIASSRNQTRNLIHIYCLFMFYYILLCFIIFIFYYILFVSLYLLIYTYYTVAKKENALIIHIAMETWEYTIIRNFITLYLCLFSNYSHTLWLKTRCATDGYKYKTINLQLTQ